MDRVRPTAEVVLGPSRPVLVAGIGNVFHGDGGFGVEVVRRLEERRLPPGVDVTGFGIRGADLMYAFGDGYTTVVLVGALARGHAPGTVSLIEPDIGGAGGLGFGGAAFDAHGFDTAKVLRLALDTGRVPARILLVACEPSSRTTATAWEMRLSAPVGAAVDEAVRLTGRLVAAEIDRLPAGRPASRPAMEGDRDAKGIPYRPGRAPDGGRAVRGRRDRRARQGHPVRPRRCEPMTATVTEVFRRRAEPGAALAGEAETIATACHAMAARFHRGGRLFTFGNGGAATDAQHVAVEFVHPVIVGKRALPALSLTGDVATLTGIGIGSGFDEIFAHQLRCFGEPDDMAIGISPDGRCGNVLRGLDSARDLGMLTVALAGGDGGALAEVADHLVTVPSGDPRVIKEVHVTAYHVLWELVHVFLEHPDVLNEEAVT